MPYHIKKVNSGYKVAKKSDGKTFSKKPMTEKKAKKQMAAIGISESKQKAKKTGLTPAQEKKLKEHSKHHSSKHMAMMRKDMKNGLSFTKAHNKAKKAVGN